MSHSRPHTATPQAYTIEFIPGRIDSPEDFPRPSVYLESTVAARSSYLLTKLNPPFDGYNIPRVELSSANPKGFKLYAKWLEAGYLAFPTSDVLPTGSVPHNSLSWSECEVLVKAHILGSQFGDELFQDQVMNEMIRWLKPDQGVDWGICKMVFGKQASGVSQKLQCLVVDRMFADEMEGDKLLSLFMKRRLAGRIGDLELGETCEYHVHEGEQCDERVGHNSVSIGEVRKSTGVVGTSGMETERTAEIAKRNYSTELRRSRRKPVPEPWNFSAQSHIPRIFDHIERQASTRHTAELSHLPPPQIHPSILRDFAPNDRRDRRRRSEPPSRRQDFLFRPPALPPRIHPRVLQGLSANDRLLAEVHQAPRPFASGAPHRSRWPIRPPTPFHAGSLPGDDESRPSSPNRTFIHATPPPNNFPEDWPLRNSSAHDLAPSPASRTASFLHRQPTPFHPSVPQEDPRDRPLPRTPDPPPVPIPFSPAPYLESATYLYHQIAHSPSVRRKPLTGRTPSPIRISPPPSPLYSKRHSPPAPPDRKQQSWPPDPSRKPQVGLVKRKPAPDNGLEFLARYPEGKVLISRARGAGVGERHGSIRTDEQRPVELQGRPVRLAELMCGEGRPGTA